jgi:anti-anti-sigma factor
VAKSMLTFKAEDEIGLARVKARQVMKAADIEELSHEFRQQVAASDLKGYILDLSGLEYLTSGAISMIINMDAHLKAGGKSFAVVARSGMVDETLRQTHLDELFPIVESVELAMKKLKVKRKKE